MNYKANADTVELLKGETLTFSNGINYTAPSDGSYLVISQVTKFNGIDLCLSSQELADHGARAIVHAIELIRYHIAAGQ